MEPLRWLLVERRYAEVVNPQEMGDGTINPHAMILVFQPLYAEDLRWEVVVDPKVHFVELLGTKPEEEAAPGEVVTATLRVGKARNNCHYRLRAQPSTPNVRLIGKSEHTVRGAEPAHFHFTSTMSGRGGISVIAEEVP